MESLLWTLLIIGAVVIIVLVDKLTPVKRYPPATPTRKMGALEARYAQWAADKARRSSECCVNYELDEQQEETLNQLSR